MERQLLPFDHQQPLDRFSKGRRRIGLDCQLPLGFVGFKYLDRASNASLPVKRHQTTKLYNRNTSGAPYQCANESMPKNSINRGGYAAFNNMLKPVMDDAAKPNYLLHIASLLIRLVALLCRAGAKARRKKRCLAGNCW